MLPLILCALPLAGDADATRLNSGTVDLAYRTYRNWKIDLPEETFRRVSTELPGGFAVKLDGVALLVDADGSGDLERRVEGTVDDAGVRSALLVCRRGDDAPRGFRLQDTGQGWTYAPAGAAVGKLGDTKLQIVDQDGDGLFNGYGYDAMIVGSGHRAQFLSRSVNVAGELYSIDVYADGTGLDYSVYDGETGVLDFTTDLDADAKLLTAVVKSATGEHSFDLAGAPKGMKVPVGRYDLFRGEFGLGRATVDVLPSRGSSLTVTSEGTSTLDWGGPVRAEFSFQRQGDQIAFHPDYVWYYGAAGEQYVGWNPIGKSPTFKVKEKASGEELAKAVFAGST